MKTKKQKGKNGRQKIARGKKIELLTKMQSFLEWSTTRQWQGTTTSTKQTNKQTKTKNNNNQKQKM